MQIQATEHFLMVVITNYVRRRQMEYNEEHGIQ